MAIKNLVIGALLSLMVGEATAQEFKFGSITVTVPWSRATPKGAAVAAGFMVVHNSGSSADRLLGGESDAAKEVQVHEMAMDNQVMKMRQLTAGLEIPAGATVELKPGGYHLMLMGLAKPLAENDRYKITLNFERAGKVIVDFKVGSVGGPSPMATQSNPGMNHHMHPTGQ